VKPIDELLARDAIRQLAERYALAADGRDLDGLAALFVPDVDNGRYGQGAKGVKRFYDQSLRKHHCSVHFVGNHVIDFDDDEHAHGVVYCHAQHHVLEPEHWWDEVLAYWDTYELVDGSWRFRRRRVRSWYRQETEARTVAGPAEQGPKRGAMMPDAFPTFEPFWSRAPLDQPD
jgi:hypothetical protein